MLSRRLLFGSLIIAVLLGVSWLDVCISRYGFTKEIIWLPRGIALMPVYLVCLVFLTREVLRILNAAGLHPLPHSVYLGTLFIAVSCWIANVIQQFNLDILHHETSRGGWQWAATASFSALLAVAVGVILAFAAEMRRYEHPGGVTINLAGAVFAYAYLGLLSCFMIQLHMAYEIWAILSLVIVTKMCDVGAFTVGKLIGTHRMTPGLSPGKTFEGAVGGILFACAGSWFWFDIVLPYFDREKVTPFIGWVSFGMVVALTGMTGDLAGSLIKRDSRMKDSGHAVPGFGGVLDIFDSLLMAAPAAYVFWVFGFVCSGKH
ncbi:MAG: phosphatidate cytidylyltransferase [Planctomycetaceae bacterium]|jgi:phosphatidate cytidylyltransferase|nr:phosphatidate cytidylyltransferase [Planctomycetaceae bacterium]